MTDLQAPFWIEDPDGMLLWQNEEGKYVKAAIEKKPNNMKNILLVATGAVIFFAGTAVGYMFYTKKNAQIKQLDDRLEQ